MSKQEQISTHLEAMTVYDANNTCMTIKECAEFLNVHKKTISRQIEAGKINASLIGTTWRIPKIQFLNQIINK